MGLLDGVVGAGVTAAGGVIGGIASAVSNRNSQKRQYQYNSLLQHESANLQNQMWFEQYNKMLNDQLKWREDERYYNSPTAQMERMKDAGINPTFGNGGINAGNYSLNPEFPGTSASVGAPGVGNYQTQFGNPLGEGVSQALAERAIRVQEKKVGIEENLSAAQVDKYMAEIQEILSQKDLNNEQKEFVKEKVPLVRSQVTKNSQEVLQKWQGLLLDVMSLDLQRELGYMRNSREIERNQAGFIEANAATSQAMSRKGELQLAREKWDKEVEFRGRQLDQESEKLLQSFEKQGMDAVFKAIDEASVGIGATKFGLGFNYLNEAKLSRLISILSASHRFFQQHDFSQIDSKDPIEFKNFLDGYKKFNDLLESLKNVPSVYESLPPFLQNQFTPVTSPIP